LCELYPAIRDQEHGKDANGDLKSSVSELLANIYSCICEHWPLTKDVKEKREIETFLLTYNGKAPHNNNGQFLEATEDKSHSILDLLETFSRQAFVEGISFIRRLPRGYPQSGLSAIGSAILDRIPMDNFIDSLHILLPWLHLVSKSKSRLQVKKAIFGSMLQLMRDAAAQETELSTYSQQLDDRYCMKYELTIQNLDTLIIHLQEDTQTCLPEVKDMVTKWHKESREFTKFVIQIVTERDGQATTHHERIEIGE